MTQPHCCIKFGNKICLNMFKLNYIACGILKCTSIKFVQIMALGPKWFRLRSCMLNIDLIRDKKDISIFVCSGDLIFGI